MYYKVQKLIWKHLKHTTYSFKFKKIIKKKIQNRYKSQYKNRVFIKIGTIKSLDAESVLNCIQYQKSI